MRRTDRWLVGLVVFLIGVVLATSYIGGTSLWRQQRATCYQLRAIEQAEQREESLALQARSVAERATHRLSARQSHAYASGLRAIVPGCPKPSPLPPERRR
jgi:hypothetical protein